MRAYFNQNHNDWAYGVVIFTLCGVLTILQYRWTGDVADAEMSRLRTDLDVQAHAMARSFDMELTSGCRRLIPESDEFANQSLEAVHLARFRNWKATNPRPIFDRIALAMPTGDKVQLLLLDQTSGQFTRADWPREWSALRQNLTNRVNGNAPPFDDEQGVLVEFPVFAGTPDLKHEHWLIVELDVTYARTIWLPELASRYLDSGGQSVDEAIVRTIGKPDSILYSSQTNSIPAEASVVAVPFNFLGRTLETSPARTRQGARWMLETWQPPGALESLVSATRLRNLAVAAAVNLLMLATGIVLIRHTRQSREIAEQQMKFVASVSHELRTPLTVIRGAAHNIQRGVVTEPGQVGIYSGLIIENCEQLTDMIEQVLALAGAQNSRVAGSREPVPVADMVNEAIVATAQDVHAAHCELHLELPPVLPAVVGDAASLRRVFQNLITNAAKHGGQGGWIGITAAADETNGKPMVEIKVADRGPGIPANELPEVFKPFFRGEGAAQVRGSGLGLSLVREIVEAHDGFVSVQSEIGSGATFTVRLPVAEPEKEP